jgi:hypothetical protein
MRQMRDMGSRFASSTMESAADKRPAKAPTAERISEPTRRPSEFAGFTGARVQGIFFGPNVDSLDS